MTLELQLWEPLFHKKPHNFNVVIYDVLFKAKVPTFSILFQYTYSQNIVHAMIILC